MKFAVVAALVCCVFALGVRADIDFSSLDSVVSIAITSQQADAASYALEELSLISKADPALASALEAHDAAKLSAALTNSAFQSFLSANPAYSADFAAVTAVIESEAGIFGVTTATPAPAATASTAAPAAATSTQAAVATSAATPATATAAAVTSTPSGSTSAAAPGAIKLGGAIVGMVGLAAGLALL